ncbi:ATP-binding cassette domain-containing protein, partial [Flavobacteriaceae bacterium]|nr:ATP-binding cassette domain-containing protein [Flavobacteriaceae bacterium]
MNLLSVEGISKSFGERLIFQPLSFGVSIGQKIALIAKNGSGKTTLLKIIAQQETPDLGE